MIVNFIIDEIVWKHHLSGVWNDEWRLRYARLKKDGYISWAILSFLSTCISLFGIYKIN